MKWFVICVMKLEYKVYTVLEGFFINRLCFQPNYDDAFPDFVLCIHLFYYRTNEATEEGDEQNSTRIGSRSICLRTTRKTARNGNQENG